VTAGRRLPAALLALLLAVLALLGWRFATRAGPEHGHDAAALVAYAEILDAQGRLPSENESYEFFSPPAYLWLAVRLDEAADEGGDEADAAVSWLSGTGARLGWLAVVAAAAFLLARHRRPEPAWLAGLALAVLAGLAALARVADTAAEIRWTSGQLVSIASMVGLVAVSWLLGRELWPERRYLPLLGALAVAALPVVLRQGVMFHPEILHAFFAALALWLVVRAGRRGWPLRDGAVAGVPLGLAALTRPTAALVLACLGAFALLAGRRRALPFAFALGIVALAVVSPWWARQIDRYGNPLESNLDRYVLTGGQPREFYVSAPVEDMILRPYRPQFANELLPKFQTDLWGDWFGAQHRFWPEPPSGTTDAFLTTQAILGLGLSALAIAGLLGLGLPALARVLRGRPLGGDLALAAFTTLAFPAWAAFVVQLVRFPQEGGDPIRPAYLLFLAPCFALAGVALAERFWQRGLAWRVVLAAWSAAYAGSYAGYLVTAYPTGA
jgi:hypothetical protein